MLVTLQYGTDIDPHNVSILVKIPFFPSGRVHFPGNDIGDN